MLEWGFKGLTLAHDLAAKTKLLGSPRRVPQATTGKPRLQDIAVELVRRPIRVELPKRSYRAELGLEDRTMIPILRDSARVNDESDAVFYFPGCGSERLFSDIGLATLAWVLSQTGGAWCLQTHAFQFHGLWHWLAGAAAILLYFFWRAAPR